MRDTARCMGLFVASRSTPPSPPGHGAHDRLPAGVHRDPLDPDHLRLTLAPAPVQRLQQHGVGAHQPVGLRQVLVAVLARLLAHRPRAEALHRRVVQPEQLRRHHALDRHRAGRRRPGSAAPRSGPRRPSRDRPGRCGTAPARPGSRGRR
jgi:hypothetical protein